MAAELEKTDTNILNKKDSNNLDKLCIPRIHECILFLGPQFATNQEGEKLCGVFKEKLTETWGDAIDFRYDNLFLIKKLRPGNTEKLKLSNDILELYSDVLTHDIYSKIPLIPFSAIISCSPDNFLKKAFKSQQIPVCANYYSAKGVSEELANKSESKSKKPDGKAKSPGLVPKTTTVLYNVFGSLDDPDSLVITYQGFFNFLTSVMAEEQQVPLDLRDRIVKAKTFLLVGFDITKWYIPLIIHKLNSFSNSEERMALVNGLNGNHREDEINNALTLEFQIVSSESIPVLEYVYKECDKKGWLKSRRDADVENTNELALWQREIEKGDLEKVAEKLKKAFEQRGLDTTNISMLIGKMADLELQIISGTVTPEVVQVERAKFRDKLLSLARRLNEIE